MNRFKRLVRVAVLLPMGLALGLVGTGEVTVDRDARSGIVMEMLLGAVGPAPLAAQNGNGNGIEVVTCGWCIEDDVYGQWCTTEEPIQCFWDTLLAHQFPNGGDECGLEGKPANAICARCGGTSGCHTDWWSVYPDGQGCHMECGSGSEYASLLQDLDTVLEAGDAAGILWVALNSPLIRILETDGAILVAPACDDEEAVASIRRIPAAAWPEVRLLLTDAD